MPFNSIQKICWIDICATSNHCSLCVFFFLFLLLKPWQNGAVIRGPGTHTNVCESREKENHVIIFMEKWNLFRFISFGDYRTRISLGPSIEALKCCGMSLLLFSSHMFGV